MKQRFTWVFLLGFYLFPMASFGQDAVAEGDPDALASPVVRAAQLGEFELENTAEEEGLGINFAEVIGYGGFVGYSILVLSVVGLALATIFFFELRLHVLVPVGLARDIEDALGRGAIEEARRLSGNGGSLLGHIVNSGLEVLHDGRPEARTVMADSADSWMGGVVRRIEYLNLIATVSPMLGLLGTVVGMVKTFAALSQSTGPVDPVALSSGIFQALVTTMMGLAVAIPILLLYTLLRNRADHVQATGVATGEQVLSALQETENSTFRGSGANL